MSFISEQRRESAQFAAAIGAVGLAFGVILAFMGSSWGWVFGGVGLLLLASGIKLYAESSAVEGVANLIAMISRHTEPKWDGETLYTDGGRHKVRYVFDTRNRPFFVADDVCNAIGADTPGKDAMLWGGAPLSVKWEHCCFTRDAVEAYLTPLAFKNHEANRLLVLIRNEVFRKLDRGREQDKLL